MTTPAISARLLSVSVLLPAVAIALDAWLLHRATQLGWPTSATLAVFVLLLAQTALLSWSAGRWLPNWSWRLLVLGWSTATVNLLLYSVAIVDSSGEYDMHNMGLLLAIAFLASQGGATIVWAIQGGGKRQCRWLIAVIAAMPAGLTAWGLNAAFPWRANTWLIVALLQTVGAGLIVALLRVFGYGIAAFDDAPPEQRPREAVQFSMQQMLVWTSCVAAVVCFFQSLLQIGAQDKGWHEWLQLGIDGVVLALLTLIAAWAALSGGRSWLRALAAIVLAAGAAWLLRILEESYQAGRATRGDYTWLPTLHWLWYAWTLLAGAFLASLLLVLRATGHRLVRTRRRASE